MSEISRREFLVSGGIALSLGAVMAACGTSTTLAPGRLGTAGPPATLPNIEVDDAVLARTAQSLHLSAADVHQRVLDSGAAPDAVAAVLPKLIELHQGYAKQIGSTFGGTSFDCPNPFVAQRFVDPTMKALEGSKQSKNHGTDAAKISIAFEEWVARSHQDIATKATDTKLRGLFVALAAEVTRTSASLSAAHDEGNFNPVLKNEDPVDKDENGYPIYYVVADRFGQLGPVPIVVGEPDEEGQRFSVSLQTPAENTLIGADATCTS